MGRLLDALAAAYRQLGFDTVTGADAVFEQLVTARIIEPTSKQDAARVLEEAGALVAAPLAPPSLPADPRSRRRHRPPSASGDPAMTHTSPCQPRTGRGVR